MRILAPLAVCAALLGGCATRRSVVTGFAAVNAGMIASGALLVSSRENCRTTCYGDEDFNDGIKSAGGAIFMGVGAVGLITAIVLLTATEQAWRDAPPGPDR